MAETLEQKVARAEEAEKGSDLALALLRDVACGDHPNDAESLKAKERAVDLLAAALVARGDAPALRALLADLRPLFAAAPKAKTAKLVRALVDAIAAVPGSDALLRAVCEEQAAWAAAEKRTFLRQRLDLRLAALLLAGRDLGAALALLSKLLAEVKRLDDKLLLVEVHLLESRAHGALRNLPKARAALTAARSAAASVYVPPSLQADLDAQSGALHAEERDFRTAYSYFYEAFEARAALGDARAPAALKHMLLSKIMAGESGDVPGLAASKAGMRFAGPGVDAMRAVAAAVGDASLAGLAAALEAHAAELAGDDVVARHLAALSDSLLAANLAKIVAPYSRVEVAHVAEQIGLPPARVEAKLGQMILDGALAGTLDQGAGTLEVHDAAAGGGAYPAALATIGNMGAVVDSLFERAAAARA